MLMMTMVVVVVVVAFASVMLTSVHEKPRWRCLDLAERSEF